MSLWFVRSRVFRNCRLTSTPRPILLVLLRCLPELSLIRCGCRRLIPLTITARCPSTLTCLLCLSMRRNRVSVTLTQRRSATVMVARVPWLILIPRRVIVRRCCPLRSCRLKIVLSTCSVRLSCPSPAPGSPRLTMVRRLLLKTMVLARVKKLVCTRPSNTVERSLRVPLLMVLLSEAVVRCLLMRPSVLTLPMEKTLVRVRSFRRMRGCRPLLSRMVSCTSWCCRWCSM